MNTKSRAMFEVGKAAAIANAVVGTAQAVVNALAVPPYPLGVALAVSAGVAGAVQIGAISAQQFNPGGQADEGMDAIPQHLSGKSFILSAGERVVQPEANKQLTAFLQKDKEGKTGGDTHNITLHYNGSGGQDDAKKMASIVMEEIRRASERGHPVISSKGITS